MLGDFNTLSPADSLHYTPAANYQIHRIVREWLPQPRSAGHAIGNHTMISDTG